MEPRDGTMQKSVDESPRMSSYVKQLSLLVEYKRLRSQVPPGIYVMPSFESLYRWEGYMFARRGPYRGGVFKFVMMLTEDYPVQFPRVHFTSSIFHPQVSPSGELDFSRIVVPDQDRQQSLLYALRHLQSIFYEIDTRFAVHPVAAALYLADRDEFDREAKQCVRTSISRVHQKDRNSSFRLLRPSEESELIRERLCDGEKAKDVWGS